MKRRNFIASLLGMLAALPFLRWLKQGPEFTGIWDGTDNVAFEAWGVGTPGAIDNRERMVTWDYKEQKDIYMGVKNIRLTSHPSESIL